MISSVGSGPDLSCTKGGQNWMPIRGQDCVPIDNPAAECGLCGITSLRRAREIAGIDKAQKVFKPTAFHPIRLLSSVAEFGSAGSGMMQRPTCFITDDLPERRRNQPDAVPHRERVHARQTWCARL
ncbi:MAG: hypothetical protein IPL38_02145 [Rhodobacter sp.]|jgi:hypothetical protein|nr:hypothetical protein [Rhodobacter sp.]